MRNHFIPVNERLFLGKRRCKNDIGEENKRAWLFGGITAKLSLKISSFGVLSKKKTKKVSKMEIIMA